MLGEIYTSLSKITNYVEQMSGQMNTAIKSGSAGQIEAKNTINFFTGLSSGISTIKTKLQNAIEGKISIFRFYFDFSLLFFTDNGSSRKYKIDHQKDLEELKIVLKCLLEAIQFSETPFNSLTIELQSILAK